MSTEEDPRIVVVESLPALGAATAVAFLNWVAENPRGAVSLPTGRTPEYFIRTLEEILQGDYEAARRKFPGLQSAVRPDTSNLHFFQMDEFFPFREGHSSRSFKAFIQRFYAPLLDLKPGNLHLIDLDAICGQPVLQAVPQGQLTASSAATRAKLDAFCEEYEEEISRRGGLGFILLGVGPDGHVAFNCQGSPKFSATRVAELNYPSKAAAAGDLGGLSASDEALRLWAVTLGTRAILQAKQIVVFAAGEAKSAVIAQSVTGAADTPLGEIFRHARLFLTQGAAKLLRRPEEPAVSREEVLEKIRRGRELNARRDGNWTFIHTEPHHDDILLGYYPLLSGWLGGISGEISAHHVLSLTAGFNSVADRWLQPPARTSDEAVRRKTEIRMQEGQAFWASMGLDTRKFVRNLNLPFYSADIFTPEPRRATDVVPIVAAISDILAISDPERKRRTLLTVLTDPESSGPDTHFKCLLAVAQAAQEIGNSLEILCYRNVWTSFELHEMDALVPVSAEVWAEMKRKFLAFYRTQAAAEFPSAEFDGDFATFAELKGRELGERVSRLIGNSEEFPPAAGYIGVQLRTPAQLAALAGERLRNFTL